MIQKRNFYFSSSKAIDDLELFGSLNVLMDAEREYREKGVDVQDICGFKLNVSPSTVPNAGMGLHLMGSVNEGNVVAIYRGTVINSKDFISLQSLICPHNENLMSRSDDVFIDGGDSVHSKALFESSLFKQAAVLKVSTEEARKRAFDHPFALAQMANHPPKGIKPNVKAVSLDLFENSSVELHSFFKWINVSFRNENATINVSDPNESSSNVSKLKMPLISSVVLISVRDIKDEEIFLDYKLRSMDAPNWYHPAS